MTPTPTAADTGVCGTVAGYSRHRRSGTEPCGECRQARTDYETRRTRRNQKQGKHRPRHRRKHQPCGTSAGYKRHLDWGEHPCDPCRDAQRAVNRRRQRAKWKTECGSFTGWRRHLRLGERPCPKCLMLDWAYYAAATTCVPSAAHYLWHLNRKTTPCGRSRYERGLYAWIKAHPDRPAHEYRPLTDFLSEGDCGEYPGVRPYRRPGVPSEGHYEWHRSRGENPCGRANYERAVRVWMRRQPGRRADDYTPSVEYDLTEDERCGYPGPRPRATCGTVAGAARHRTNGEPLCGPCLTLLDLESGWTSDPPGGPDDDDDDNTEGSAEAPACGTPAAYLRHQDLRDPLCAACEAAELVRRYKRKRKGKGSARR